MLDLLTTEGVENVQLVFDCAVAMLSDEDAQLPQVVSSEWKWVVDKGDRKLPGSYPVW